MWIINRITTSNDPNDNPRQGWHCTLQNEGWQEWVEEGHYGSSALWDWKNDPEVTGMSHKFYEAGTYRVSITEYRLIRKHADRIS